MNQPGLINAVLNFCIKLENLSLSIFVLTKNQDVLFIGEL